MKADSLREIREADKRIAQLEEQQTQFMKRRSSLNIDQVNEAWQIDRELEEVAARISFFKDQKKHHEQRVAEYERNTAKTGAPLIQQETAAYDRGRSIVESIAKHQQEVAALLSKLGEENQIMSSAANQFRDLTGEEMRLPCPIECYIGMSFAAPNVPRIQLYGPWTYVSESDRAVQQDKELRQKRLAYEERLQAAQGRVPPCQTCGAAREILREAGGPGEGYWSVLCRACNMEHRVMIPK
jgi:hypothetical protein